MASSAPTVALLAPTGLLGGALLASLSKVHTAGKLKLVVIHRPSSKLDTSKLPAGVETRTLDFDKATEKDVQAAVEGVDTLISAVSNVSPEAEDRFLTALSKTKVSAYIASDYSIPWNKTEEADEGNVIVFSKVSANKKAESLNVPLTKIHNGLFQPFVFFPQFLGIDAKANALNLYGNALANKLPITSPAYLAEAIGQLVTQDPKSIAGKSYTIIEYEASGQEIADILKKVHGSAPKITSATDAELEGARNSGPPGALGSAARKKWSAGDFVANDKWNPTGVERGNIEKAVTEAAK